MKTVYLETSVILSWLLEETSGIKAKKIINDAKNIVASSLSFLEVKRALIRLEHRGTLSAANRLKLMGLLNSESQNWTLMRITEEVEERAGDKFPCEPLRSLDAVHLATALLFLPFYPDLAFASFDHRLSDNVEALGLPLVK